MKPAFPDGIWPRYKVFFLESMLLWVREDLVDHGPLRDAGDEAHHAVAGRAREGVDFKDLLQHRRETRCGQAAGHRDPRREGCEGRRYCGTALPVVFKCGTTAPEECRSEISESRMHVGKRQRTNVSRTMPV